MEQLGAAMSLGEPVTPGWLESGIGGVLAVRSGRSERVVISGVVTLSPGALTRTFLIRDSRQAGHAVKVSGRDSDLPKYIASRRRASIDQSIRICCLFITKP